MENIKISRPKNLDDLEKIMDIWLESNLEAHSFIAGTYWQDNYEYARELIPKSDLYIAYVAGEVAGFMGIVDAYIAGIFIGAKYRGQGLGTRLLELGKDNYEKLSLDVYKKNKKAYEFYSKNGFSLVEEKLDGENKEIEYRMSW